MLNDTERAILQRCRVLRFAILNTPATMAGRDAVSTALAVFCGDVLRMLEEKDAGTATDRRGSRAAAWVQDAAPLDYGDGEWGKPGA